MITQTHTVAGESVVIRTPTSAADFGADWDRFLGGADALAVDTETTGLDVYAEGHAVRLVQFGTATEAWNVRPDLFRGEVLRGLSGRHPLLMHNATYDVQVLARHGLADMGSMWERVTDTRILAHLIDPRTPSEGGIGHSLKVLSAAYVDPSAPDTSAGLTEVFRGMGHTQATGWAAIDAHHPVYTLYAGLDVILTARLAAALRPVVDALGCERLSVFEHHLAGVLCAVEARGVRLDVPYTESLRGRLLAEAAEQAAAAERYGVTNVNSTAQVAEALAAMGETLTERTPSGAVKVDRAVLLDLADLDREWKPRGTRTANPLAVAVLRSKRAGKFAETYAQGFLDAADAAGRIHPAINTLGARTARMSVSRPALQQLPAGDWEIRRAILAEPGHVFVSVDFSQVEVRVLAALCGDEGLREVIAAGGDLHSQTAAAIFGPDFTKRHRQLCKGIVFGRCYGGGAATIARQTGAALTEVQAALGRFDRAFPGISRWASRLQRAAEYGAREVVTPAGRHLPLDRDRLYAATNYMIQSTARDLMAQAVVDMHAAGLTDGLRMVIHDEVLVSAPAAEAADMAARIEAVMRGTFGGVAIECDSEIADGPSWGHLYGAPADLTGDTTT